MARELGRAVRVKYVSWGATVIVTVELQIDLHIFTCGHFAVFTLPFFLICRLYDDARWLLFLNGVVQWAPSLVLFASGCFV